MGMLLTTLAEKKDAAPYFQSAPLPLKSDASLSVTPYFCRDKTMRNMDSTKGTSSQGARLNDVKSSRPAPLKRFFAAAYASVQTPRLAANAVAAIHIGR